MTSGFEFGFGITAEVIDVREGGLLIREKRFTSGRVITGLDADPVLHDGLILLADVADRPVNGACRGVIGGRALTDVDVGVACSIDGHIGRDEGRGVLEDKLNFVTHRVGDGAATGRMEMLPAIEVKASFSAVSMFVEEEIAKKPFVGFVAQAFRTRSPSVPAWKATV